MSNLKKALALFLVIAMCAGIVPFAAMAATNTKGVTFSAELNNSTISTSATAQQVVMTVKTNKPIPVDGIGMTVIIPEGWTLEAIENDTLGFAASNVNLANGRVNYATPDAENWSTELVVKVTYNVPANVAAGTYNLGIHELTISEDYGTEWESAGDASTTLTVQAGSVPDPDPEPSVSYTATLNKTSIEAGAAQTVVMTVKASKKVPVDGIGMTVIIPEGWTLAAIENEELGFAASNVNLANGRVNYATPDAENWSTDLIVKVTYNVPASVAAGTYNLGIHELTISKDYGTEWESAGAASTSLTVTAAAHFCSGTPVSGKSATCTEDGWNEYYSCTCGKYYSDAFCSDEIADLDAWKAGAGKIAAGHKYGTLKTQVDAIHTATELKAGMKAHYICSVCGTYFTEGKVATTEAELVIPAPTHSYTNVNGYKEADGHANTCSCGAHDGVDAHTPNIPVPTETEDQKCSVCGYVIAPKTGHIHKNNLTKVDAKPAGCTEDGNEAYYKCSCGAYFEDASASVEITDKDSVKIPAGHKYGTLNTKVDAIHTATELKAGMKAHYICGVCGTYFTEGKVATTQAALVIPAPTHDYATVNGYKEADGHADTCSCGAHNTVAPHTPNIPAPTETEDQKCSVCGYVIAPALGHIHKNNLTKVEAKPAGCTEDGNIEYYECSCGAYFEDASASVEITDKDSVKIPAGHTYGEEWKSDEENHWNECVCGDKTNFAAHVDEDEDGKCDVCEHELPEEDEPADKPSNNPQTGDTSMMLWFGLMVVSTMAIVAVVVLGKKRYSTK